VTDKEMIIRLRSAIYKAETFVVTASRTQRDVEEVTIPVTVVSGEDIRRSGSMRLSDVLAEQTGMQIVNDHGTGIQVQGFDPDYSLVMIDGNPVIGRTSGTLDLSRISVKDVEQIEIVKGPSSALWGSDALAGVINIITEQRSTPFSAGLTTRYGEHNTLDLSGDVGFSTGKWDNGIFFNRNSSAGYQLVPGSVSQTVPEYENYTMSYRTNLDISDRFSITGSVRYFNEVQDNLDFITDDKGMQRILHSNAVREDFVARPTVSYSPADRLDIDLSLLTSFYKTDSELHFSDNGELYEGTHFNQFYNKPELQAGYHWGNNHHTVAGGGVIFERLEAERYPSHPDFTTQFVFGQHAWKPGEKLELTGGLRFDTHSEYSSQLSPKFSGRYNAADWIQLRASVGRGFKAPDFRQLFLDFTNSTAGYSVFGSSTAVEGISRLQNEGNISQVLMPVSSINEIKAESSWAANVGFDMDLFDPVRLRLNVFRNNVTDLIETTPVARKTNGQSVFTYINVEEVFTQGLEAELRWEIINSLNASVGYQFLDARRNIETERTVQNSEGEVEQVTEVTFEPMFNRSKHSGNVKLYYESESGWGANIRGILRGDYGLFDINGNSYVDQNEYEPGYTVWNLAVSKRLFAGFTLQSGIDNALDYTNINVPNLPGRLWYVQASITY
ncbi:MAG: TonB-dependent receptor, partial [Balneolales bacterium]